MSTSTYVIRSARDLGLTLADARHVRGLTQAELIAHAGAPYDRSYLSRLESGEFSQQVDRALLLLRALGVTVTAEMDAVTSE